MKKVIANFVLLFSCLTGFANGIVVPALPEAVFPDTEVSTNICIASVTGSRKYTISISLNAVSSNNVEVAIGCDNLPTNGILSNYETSLCIGWDCGKWFLAMPMLETRLEADSVTTDNEKHLTIRLDIRENETIRAIEISEGPTPAFAGIPAILPSAEKWNIIRATARGPAVHNESIAVKTALYGTELIFR